MLCHLQAEGPRLLPQRHPHRGGGPRQWHHRPQARPVLRHLHPAGTLTARFNARKLEEAAAKAKVLPLYEKLIGEVAAKNNLTLPAPVAAAA